jgi:hypothetical protein
VTKDGAVLHQSIAQKHTLAAHNIVTGEHYPAIRANDFGWYRGFARVSLVSEQAPDEEAKHNNENNSLNPAPRDQKWTLAGDRHRPPQVIRANSRFQEWVMT